MNFREMENSIHGAKAALDAAAEITIDFDKAVVLASTAQAHALLVIAECAYRREIREGM